MKFFIATLTLAAAVMANPLVPRQAAPAGSAQPLCGGLTGTPLCCATDVLGVADLDCIAPATTPTSLVQFTQLCAVGGQRARCCALPILQQGIVCSAPA